jgi:hypothetical protein
MKSLAMVNASVPSPPRSAMITTPAMRTRLDRVCFPWAPSFPLRNGDGSNAGRGRYLAKCCDERISDWIPGIASYTRQLT